MYTFKLIMMFKLNFWHKKRAGRGGGGGAGESLENQKIRF